MPLVKTAFDYARHEQRSRQDHLSGRALRLLLCFILLFRILVPFGYMPDLDGLRHGVIKLVICSSSGKHTLILPADYNPKKDHPASDGKAPQHVTACPFAGLQHHADLPAISAFTVALFWFVTHAPRPQDHVRQSSVLLTAWPRAPPV